MVLLLALQMFRLLVVALSLVLSVSLAKEDGEKDLGTVIGIDLGTTYSW